MEIEESSKILIALKTVRQLHNDISLLLQTAEELIVKNIGWTPAKYNQCLAYQSDVVANYEKWMPHYLFRFFQNPQSNSQWCFVTIVLDEIYKKESFNVPLVGVGVVEYEEGTFIDKPHNWDASAPLWLAITDSDYGKKILLDEDAMGRCESGAQRIVIVCEPLVSVDGTTTLEEKVIRPLEDIIQTIK